MEWGVRRGSVWCPRAAGPPPEGEEGKLLLKKVLVGSVLRASAWE